MSLQPIPFAVLVRRLVRELAGLGDAGGEHAGHDQTVLELPARRIYRGPGPGGPDLAVRHHGRRASNPLGPAAGPHTQLAQNIVVAWLAGCRIFELKTVQVRDDLVIPRPCIDMATVGYNVEWSQELSLEDSAREYVKAAMLVTMLRQGGLVAFEPGTDETLFDLSVGYDLAGIQSPAVGRFLDHMADATSLIAALRAEIPPELAPLGALDFPRTIARSVTLSTFHGCPPSEIEAIATWLMRERKLDVTVKLNPTLLGQASVEAILRGVLGYDDIEVPDHAFRDDATWDAVHGIVSRLTALAHTLGRSFGIKLTNTLVVRNHRDFFPASEPVMYLSGPPLHVLASALLSRFREAFGEALPISFSAGIDRKNFADAVACALVPVTVCSDLLQPGGYGRAQGYLVELAQRMQAVGAHDVASFVERAYPADPTLLVIDDAAVPLPPTPGDAVHNARYHAAQVLTDPRYGQAKNARPPKKLARTLARFDCTSCDKCLPVCPNTAIFALDVVGHAPRQIAIFADACNDCGNCDVFCPEHGAPNLSKPRFHGTRQGYEAAAPRDGIFVVRHAQGFEAWARLDGGEHHVTSDAPPESGAARDAYLLAAGALASPHGSWLL